MFENAPRQQMVANIPMVNGDVMKLTQGGRLLPYIKDTVFCNFGRDYFSTFAEMWMDKDYVPATEIFHIEEGLQIYTIKITANAAAGTPGGAVTLTYGANIVTGMTNIQPGFWVGIPPIGKLGKIVSVNYTNRTFVVEPADITYQITLTAGNELIIIPASIMASCSCDIIPSSKKIPGLMYKSQMMIIKKNLKICGEDLAKWLEGRNLFPMKKTDDKCEDVEVWWHEDLSILWREFTFAKQMFVMLGEDITNNTANFTNLKSTTGVLPIMRTMATQLPVALATGTNYAYWEAFTKKIKRLRNYCTQYGVWQGANHRAQTDAAFEGKVTKFDVSWDFLDNDKERGIRFGFDAAKINGIEFYFHEEASLNDPGFLGAEGFNGPDTTIAVPLCKLQCGQRGLSTPIVINYLAGNGINRELMENDYGYLRPGSESSNCDWHAWDLASQFGIDFYCPKFFVYTEGI